MSAHLRRRCADPASADALRRAVLADNPDFVSVTVEGSDLVVAASADSPSSLRETIEDLLACLGAAEKALGLARP